MPVESDSFCATVFRTARTQINKSCDTQIATAAPERPDEWLKQITQTCADVTATLTEVNCNLRPSDQLSTPQLSLFGDHRPDPPVN